MSDIKLGIALSGGGARGYCHIGVLKELEKHGIRPHAISGTSMGAVVGGMYASGISVSQMVDMSKKFTSFKMADINAFRILKESLFKGEKIRRILLKVANKKNIEEFNIPFVSVSFDVVSGKPVYIDKGPIDEAIYSSMAIPGVFKPFEKDGMKLIDGGVYDNLPHKVLRKMGCNVIITVDAIGGYDGDMFPSGAMSSIMNSFNIQTRLVQKLTRNKQNIEIVPVLDGISNFEFKPDNARKAIKAGQDATKPLISIIKNKLKGL